MIHSPFFRSDRTEPERTGKGLRFEIRRLSREELDAEDAELSELIASDSALAQATESTELTHAAAVAFMKQYEQKQAAAKAEADRKEAVDGLADAMRKARGL
jgi:hypothetical protein